MPYAALLLAAPQVMDAGDLAYYFAWAAGVLYVRKTLFSIRNRGVIHTAALVKLKLWAIVDVFFPPTIWGSAVGLRSVKSRLSESEVARVYAWSRDIDILRWSAGAPAEQTIDEFRAQLQRDRWHPESYQRLFYIVTRAGEVIGKIGLYDIDWAKRQGELGIILDKHYWSQQYGREASRLFISYVFAKTSIDRIHAGTFKDNLRAQRAAAACGFRIIGTATRYNPILNEHVEGVVMEVTRQDYRSNS